MAVQQNKKSPSKRGMHRAHDFLSNPPLAVEPTTGEAHLRHHISPSVATTAARKVVKTKRRISRLDVFLGDGLRHAIRRGFAGWFYRPRRAPMTVVIAIDVMGVG